MTVYVAVRLLDAGARGYIQPGSCTRLEWLVPEQIERMLRRGVVRRVETPPLSDLAGWKTRAARLAQLDPPVVTMDDFLDADDGWLAECLRVRPETIARYAQELQAWMIVPSAKKRG